MLCEKGVRFLHVLIHIVIDDLTGGIVEGEKSSSWLLPWSYGYRIIYMCCGFGIRRIESMILSPGRYSLGTHRTETYGLSSKRHVR
jgi:hypothetical protein